MQIASYTVNQLSLVDEKNTALKDLFNEIEWQGEALLRLSLPFLPMIDAVASLDEVNSLDNLRDKLVTELKALKRRGRDENIAPALLDKLCFVWAAFFDERISYECKLDTTQWQNNTLVSQLFGIRNSGETFFSLLKQLMEFPKKHIELIKICYLLLQLGFKGKFNNQQQAELNKIIADVNFAITELGAFKEQNTVSPLANVERKSHISYGLFKGVSATSFVIFIVFLMLAGLISYNVYVGKIYQSQHHEYDEMAKNTFAHLQQLKHKPISIENAQFTVKENNQKPVVTTAPITLAPEIQPDSQVDTATQYFVQLGAFYERSRALALQQKCGNEDYQTVIEDDGARHRVGFIADGFTSAKKVSAYFSSLCRVSPFIKEYQ